MKRTLASVSSIAEKEATLSFESDLTLLLPRLRRFARALTHDAADADA